MLLDLDPGSSYKPPHLAANRTNDSMAQTAYDVIVSKAHDFLAALGAGRTEFTSADLAGFFLEPKKVKELVTVPEFDLGPIAEARSAMAARVVASLVGASVESTREGFKFTVPPGVHAAIPTVVTKVVETVREVPGPERIVYRAPEGLQAQAPKEPDLEARLKFPDAPELPKANPKYQMPEWYGRMKAALDAGKHASLAGPPGIGKSSAPEHYFIKRGQPFVVVNGDAGFRRRDIEGTTEIQQGTTFFLVAEFAAAAINGWGCILNEVNAADPDALLFINGILEVPNMVNVHGKAYPVHPDFRLVVTYNPGLVGTKPLPQAFKDRFFPIKLSFPGAEFLRALVVAKTGVSTSAGYMGRLLKYAADCWVLHEKGTLRYQISPRRLFDAVFLLESGIASDLETAIKQGIIEAVDSPADVQTMTTLIKTPLASIQPTPRFA